MLYRFLILLFLFFGLGTHAFSQGMMQQKKKDVLPKIPQYQRSGWTFFPGITYAPSLGSPRKITAYENADTLLRSNLIPSGRIGIVLGVGRYRILTRFHFFNLMDYGFLYKSFRGRERFEDEYIYKGVSSLAPEQSNTFGNHYASVYFNMSNIHSLRNKKCIQTGFGLNADYAFIANAAAMPSVASATRTIPPVFVSQLHVKFGIGHKFHSDLLMIIGLEMPILSVLPFSANSGLQYFNSSYRPLMLTMQFYLFREFRLGACPPVRSIDLPEGYDN